MIYTSSSADVYVKSDSAIQCVISPEGGVEFYKFLNSLKTRCEIEITWFPYDEQKCTLILASTIYRVDFIRYTEWFDSADTLVLENFIDNKLWDLVKYNDEFVERVYEGYSGKYAEIHVHLIVKRKPLYVITNLMVPALCLSVITLISFYVPFAQAMPIGISIVLSFSVLSIRLIIKRSFFHLKKFCFYF